MRSPSAGMGRQELAMAIKTWWHSCRRDGGNRHITNGTSCTCSFLTAYTFAGYWYGTGLDRAMRHAKFFGIKQGYGGRNPPHQELMWKLMKPVYVCCEVCAGEGIIGQSERHYEPCGTCMGFGLYYIRSLEEVQEIRRRIIAEYPDAGCEMPTVLPEFKDWFKSRDEQRRKRRPSP